MVRKLVIDYRLIQKKKDQVLCLVLETQRQVSYYKDILLK